MNTLKIEVRPYESSTQAIHRTLKEIKDTFHAELVAHKNTLYTLEVSFEIQGETHTQVFQYDEVRMELTDSEKWQRIKAAMKEIEDREKGPY